MSELRTAPRAGFADRVLGDCLDDFPEVVFAVTGHCMSPDLREGERVRLVSKVRRRPRLGDVVLTRRGGTLQLHRLVWAPRLWPHAGFRTQADRAAMVDPSLAEADILGTVVAVLGRRGYRRRPARALYSLGRATLTRLRSALRALRSR